MPQFTHRIGSTTIGSLARECSFSALLIAAMACSPTVRAQTSDAPASTTGGSPFVLISDAANVTHWGLGAGVDVRQSIYRGYSFRVTPIPILYFDDKWVTFAGTTLDIKLINLQTSHWGSVLVNLRGTYDFSDGYRGAHAPALNGMSNRNGAFWYGPALQWNTTLGTVNAQFLTAGNKGQRASLEFERGFAFSRLTATPHVGIEWLGHKYVDYYYGVLPSEARPGRDEYTGAATYAISAGARFDYTLTPHQTVSLDLNISRYGNGVSDSPIVNRRTSNEATLYYLYRF